MKGSFLFSLLSFLLILQFARSGGEYKELTSDNFENSIRENPYVLVLFYNSSAYEGNRKVKEIADMQKGLSFVSENTLFGGVDVITQQSIVDSMKIKTFPEIKFFYFGIPISYTNNEEELSSSNVHKWLLENIRKKFNDLVPEKDLKSYERSLGKTPLQVIYIGKTTSPSFSMIKRYANVANTGVQVRYALATQKEWLDYFGITDKKDHIFFVSKYTKATTEYTGNIILRDLHQWIETMKFPQFYKAILHDPHEYNNIYKETRPFLYLFVPHTITDKDEINEYSNILEEASTNYIKDKINTVFVSLKKEEANDFLFKLNVTSVSVFIYENLYNKLRHIKYKMPYELTAENIGKFVDDWLNRKAARFYKTQELAAPTDDHNVPYLTRSNFNDIIKKSGKDVFVYFYTVWGTNGQNGLNLLYQVKAYIENTYLKDNVMVVRCDASLNDIPDIVPGPQRFSAFSRKSAPGQWINYGELRELSSVLKFIEKHTTTDKPIIDLQNQISNNIQKKL